TSAASSSCWFSPARRWRSRRRGASARAPVTRGRRSKNGTPRATIISRACARPRRRSSASAICWRRTSRRRPRSPRGCGTRSCADSAGRLLAVLGDRVGEVGVLLARNQADVLQRGQVRLRLGEVVHHQVGLAGVLVRAAVPGIEYQRPLVVLEGEIHLTGVAIRVAEIIL